MADDKPKKPEGRVLAGSGSNIFKSATGGRSDYGGLIISALTGMSSTELAAQLHKRGLSKAEAEKLQKEVATGGEVDASLLDAEDQFFRDYLRIHGGPSLIAPPIAPERLERLVSENDAVEPCIAAMVTNVSCTGMEVMPVEEAEADLTDEQKEQRSNIWDFLDECSPRQSFQMVRKKLRRDLHTTGNSYMVVERNAMGELAFIKRAPAKSMRMIKLDEAVPVEVNVIRNGQEVAIKTLKAERRFAQKVGTKLVYYKEYGASRDLNRVTGEWAAAGSLPASKRAHEVIHDKDIEDVKSPYGMPRWINQLPSVLGSRMAEENNLAFFQSGGLPPVMIFVTGGIVSEEVAQAINNYLSGTAKDKQRGVAVEVPSSGDLTNEKPANVTVETFGAEDKDSTHENYLMKNEERVRRSFRIPGIFLGMSDNYNFATAHAAYVVAEAQVFKPERDEEDERYNMTIMREIDESREWRIKSNPLTVQDVNLQLKGLQMLAGIKGVGVTDLVNNISQVIGLEVKVAEEHEEDVVGTTGATDDMNAGEPPPDQQDASGQPQAGQAAPPPPQAASDTPEQQAVQRQAQVFAARMARTVREYDDLQDQQTLHTLISLQDEYEGMTPAQQDIVNRALQPLMFASTFLADAAYEDVGAAYAMCAFHAARAATKGATQ